MRNPRHHDELTITFLRWLMDSLPGEEFPDPSELLRTGPLWHHEALCRGMGPGSFVTSRGVQRPTSRPPRCARRVRFAKTASISL